MSKKNGAWRWIPTSEKLPEEHEEVFIMEMIQPGDVEGVLVWVGTLFNGKFMLLTHGAAEPGHIDAEDVDFWAEIPPPPKKKEKDNGEKS